MMFTPGTTRPLPAGSRRRPSEEGYVLVAVMFLLAMFIIALSVAVPKMRASIELDRERETMQRGKQYARAIKLYYKKFNAYPPNIEALVMTNNIRFLRKRYTDPMTGKDDWHPIRFGENKTPIAMGFFGQPLALSGSTVAGTGVSGGNTLSGSSSLTDSSGTTQSNATTTTGASNTITGSTTSTSSTAQTFGGAGIIGFAPGKQAQSILLYKKKDHVNEWEFLYSPAADKVVTFGSATTVGSSSSSGSNSITGTSTGSSTSSTGSNSTTP